MNIRRRLQISIGFAVIGITLIISGITKIF